MIVTVEVKEDPFLAVWMRFEPENSIELQPRAGNASYDSLADTPVVTELLPSSPVRSVDDIHPDLVALAALLVCGQATVGSIRLPHLPSIEMIEAARLHFNVEIYTSDESEGPCLKSREGSVPGLAFSGGIDSCAALLMLPRTTVSVFLNRFLIEGRSHSLYDASAAMASVQAVQDDGRAAVSLRCNVETIRKPVGFPVDWSNALPLVLNAGELELSSVSFGTVLESASGLGKAKYSDLSARTIYKRWAPAFAAAKLEMSLPVSCLSEVLTSKVVREHGGFMLPQSCVRGVPGVPCRRCFKCFRKLITEWALGGEGMTADEIRAAVMTKEVTSRLRQRPIHHEIGLAWAVSNVRTGDALIGSLQERAQGYSSVFAGLDFLERPYTPNLNKYVPESIRQGVIRKAGEFFAAPEVCDGARVESWDVEAVIESAAYLSGADKTDLILDQAVH